MKTLLIAIIIPLVISSCGVFKPVEDNAVTLLLDPVVPERRITGSSPAVAIARPALPGYLDRQQLVSRSSGGELRMNPNQVWAEPLATGISRVTALNLARLTNSLNVQPVESFITLDYQTLLEIRISRFEPDASGNLILECTWKLQPVTGRLADTRSFSTTVPAITPDPAQTSATHGAQTAAMNEALGRLAREIARAL
ncbi:MAG: PqiC family protein [Verrucomicrobiales bacterium]|nr:PqiC family protein [Verrucomicrobiota bacterium JB025]